MSSVRGYQTELGGKSARRREVSTCGKEVGRINSESARHREWGEEGRPARSFNHRVARQQLWLAGGRLGEKATGYLPPRSQMFENLAFGFISWG